MILVGVFCGCVAGLGREDSFGADARLGWGEWRWVRVAFELVWFSSLMVSVYGRSHSLTAVARCLTCKHVWHFGIMGPALVWPRLQRRERKAYKEIWALGGSWASGAASCSNFDRTEASMK